MAGGEGGGRARALLPTGARLIAGPVGAFASVSERAGSLVAVPSISMGRMRRAPLPACCPAVAPSAAWAGSVGRRRAGRGRAAGSRTAACAAAASFGPASVPSASGRARLLGLGGAMAGAAAAGAPQGLPRCWVVAGLTADSRPAWLPVLGRMRTGWLGAAGAAARLRCAQRGGHGHDLGLKT